MCGADEMRIWGASLSLLTLASSLALDDGRSFAQTGDQDVFRRDRNTPVRGRDRPEYDAQGMRAGGFVLYPELGLSVESNSNVFADDTLEQSDLALGVEARGSLESNWNTHALNLRVEAINRAFQEFSTQDAFDWGVGGDLRIDGSRRFSLFASGGYRDAHELPADSPAPTALEEPAPFQHARGEVGFERAFDQLRLSGRVGGDNYDYEDAALAAGGTLENDDRDHVATRAQLRVDLAVSPSTALFVSAEANARDYDLAPPAPGVTVNRDATGYEILAGASFDVTRMATGEVGIGYLTQEYDEPGSESASGLAVNASIDWHPDELVTFNVSARRAAEPARAAGALGSIDTDVSASLDYEFRRNIILSVRARAERDEFDGVDRDDDRVAIEIQGDYAVNRAVSYYLNVGHYEQDSSGVDAGRDFSADRAVIGVRLRR